MIILSRQARDKHRGNTQKRMAFFLGEVSLKEFERWWRQQLVLKEDREQNPKTVFRSTTFDATHTPFYQDRLGTNIGKALKKWTARFSGDDRRRKGENIPDSSDEEVSVPLFLNFSYVCPEPVLAK